MRWRHFCRNARIAAEKLFELSSSPDSTFGSSTSFGSDFNSSSNSNPTSSWGFSDSPQPKHGSSSASESFFGPSSSSDPISLSWGWSTTSSSHRETLSNEDYLILLESEAARREITTAELMSEIEKEGEDLPDDLEGVWEGEMKKKRKLREGRRNGEGKELRRRSEEEDDDDAELMRKLEAYGSGRFGRDLVEEGGGEVPEEIEMGGEEEEEEDEDKEEVVEAEWNVGEMLKKLGMGVELFEWDDTLGEFRV